MCDRWFQETKVADRVKAFLIEQGYDIKEFRANKHEHGPDIEAEAKDGSIKVVVEVKGYPSEKVELGRNRGKIKSPSKIKGQARTWFAKAFLKLSIERSKDAKKVVAFGLPDHKIYRRLVEDISYARRRLNLTCFFVKEDETVEEVKPF